MQFCAHHYMLYYMFFFITSRGLLYTGLLTGICITVVLLLHCCVLVPPCALATQFTVFGHK